MFFSIKIIVYVYKYAILQSTCTCILPVYSLSRTYLDLDRLEVEASKAFEQVPVLLAGSRLFRPVTSAKGFAPDDEVTVRFRSALVHGAVKVRVGLRAHA